ncbi:sugar porter family MFS transporter [Fodinisporobacter ferrooxydans]|uniref:Sugar porter family MFS transporter n=1 Tax=Fodinisporobacter ferrooxydans TaxID=2901836 RepID=A0ABY4CED5_9BACL|nr:sugar porter family MFS transporter [Alicyclobacillaceae bacterium MYW30-H2]
MFQVSAINTKKKNNLLIYLFGALADLLFGYDVGVIGVALLFIKHDMQLTPILQGLVVSSLLIGAMIGVASCGVLSDRFGRRRIILLTGFIFSFGAIGTALSPSVVVLILFRFIMGLGVGAASVVVTVYLAEMAPSEKRGALTSLNQFMVVVGILVAYLVDYGLAPFGAWRLMLGIGLIPSVILLIGMYFQPETPRWLMKKGMEKEAREVLGRFLEDSSIEKEIEEIKLIQKTGTEKVGVGELFVPWLRRILIVAVGIAVFPQIMGINSIIYYAPTILTKVGFGKMAAILANVGIGTINVLVTLVAIRLIDRIGRKKLLLLGTTGMALSMFIVSFAFFNARIAGGATSWIILLFMTTYVASFGVSWGTVVRVLISEILPLRIRGSVMGYVLVFNWGFNFLIGMFFPIFLNALGLGKVFIVFGVIGIGAFFFVRKLVPETKQRSLEEIEVEFRGSSLTV